MKKYLMIPSSSDLNRGDQALVWQTKVIAENAGYNGEFYMLASEIDRTAQSVKENINPLLPILKHPSRMFSSNDNTEYNFSLKLKWGIVAIFDLIFSLLLLTKPTRSIVKLFMSKEDRKTLSIFEEADATFVKGGGFIHSAGKLTDTYTVYYQLFHIFLAQSLGKPVYVMPNSFGPFDGLGVAKMVNKALNQCELVTVRESISKKMLADIDVESHLFPDLGFGLDKRDIPSEIDKLRELHSDKRFVAITARPYRFPNTDNPTERYENYINGMISLSEWLYDKNYLPIFIDHTLSENTHESDISAVKEITSQLNSDNYYIVSNDDYDSRDLKNVYSDVDFVIGTRFHSVIFSLSENTPSLAITYGGNKGQGIMRDLDLGQYAISMSEFDFDKITKQFTNLVENEIQIKEKLLVIKDKIMEEYGELSKEISQ